MKKILYTIALTAAVAVSACTKIDGLQNDPSVMTFAPMLPSATKAILEPKDLTGSSALQVIDYRGDAGSFEASPYIDNTLSYDAGVANKWSFTGSGTPTDGYSWLDGDKRISHNFYAWLSKLPDGTDVSGVSLSADKKTITVAGNTLTPQMPAGSKQFDFCYSEIIRRDKSGSDYSTVVIPLKHLYASYGVKAVNYSQSPITITSLKLVGLKNAKGASIIQNLADGTTTVNYGDGTRDGSGTQILSGSVTIAANTSVNNLVTTNSESKDQNATDAFFLAWPQTAGDLTITEEQSVTVNESTGVFSGASGAFFIIGYKVGDDGAVKYKAIPLRPDSWEDTMGWEAGDCHHITLAFSDTNVKLTVEVLPWDLYEPEIDYSGEIQISEDGMLKVTGDGTTCTIDQATHRVYFKGGNPITCTFGLNSPRNATWMIGKDGDFDAFEIDNVNTNPETGHPFGIFGDKVDYNYGTIDGNSVTFTIYPKLDDPDKDREINLSFSVRTASELVYSIDELVQGKNPDEYYTFVLVSSK